MENLRFVPVLATLLVSSCGTSEMVPEPQGRRVVTLSTAEGRVTCMQNPDGSTEKVIGDDDLTAVTADGSNLPGKYRPLLDAFGLLEMGCSATHIGGGVVLSAGHCFDAPATRANGAGCSATVAWGLRQDRPAYLVSRCTGILAYEQNNDRDYAIFTVDPSPPVQVTVELAARPANGTVITIFGHPQARPLEWSKTCTVEAAANGGWGAGQFSHQCDTEPGNSGSTVLADQSLAVVGIHDGGRVPWNYATFLVDTPLAEVLGTVSPAGPQADDAPGADSEPIVLSGAAGSSERLELTVAAATATLVVTLSGGTGDGDLYLRYGAVPTLTVYDASSTASGNEESITVTEPAVGLWHLMVYGYGTYANATVAAYVTNGGGSPSPGEVDLGGWRIRQDYAAGEFVFPAGTVVAPGTVILVARDATQEDFLSFWGRPLPAGARFVSSAGALPRLNGDEVFTVIDPVGSAIGAPTPAATAGRVQALQADGTWLEAPATPATVSPGVTPVTTPGAALVVTEVADAVGTGSYVYEFVELVVR